MSSNEILSALSKEKDGGWGCYSRGIESLWSLIWISTLKDPFCYLRKKHPGRWSAPGMLEFLEKPGGHMAKVHREGEPSIGNEVLHVNRTTCQRVPGAPPPSQVEEPLNPQSSLIFLEVQTVKMNCKETLLSNYSLLIELPLTLCRNTCLLFSLLDQFTQAFLPPEMSFLTPLPVQFLSCFKTYLSSVSWKNPPLTLLADTQQPLWHYDWRFYLGLPHH